LQKFLFLKTQNQLLTLDFPSVSLTIKREDLIHPKISGNKYRKLKYNILQAKSENKDRLLTFGGAFSNHIAAVASAGKEYGFETIGIIRGEELADKIKDNPTLQFAQDCGMKFDFVSREIYRQKENLDFIEKLYQKWGDFYFLPEGGTNDLAIKGCEEILSNSDDEFDYICCAVGTGGTISGIINCSKSSQQVLGFPALKGDFMYEEIRNFVKKENWSLIQGYHFGGYGKVTLELIEFMNQFYKKTNIILDPIYTGKMVFGVIDLIKKNYFPPGSNILMIHTGGIQGIQGMNLKLNNKKLPLIEIND
jgi:1-aminocyclopropane-1-carboxylate deaminase